MRLTSNMRKRGAMGFGVFLLVAAAASVPMRVQAQAPTLTFDDGLTFITGGINPGAIRWSGAAGENRVPLSGADWAISPYNDGGFLNSPGFSAANPYIWMYDTVGGFTDWFEVTAATTSSASQGITYDFMNSFRTDGNTPGGFYPDVGITSADGSLILVAHVFTIPADQATNWHTISASYNTSITTWYVANNFSQPTATVATQEQVDSIIGSTGWVVRFGHENISGGIGNTGPEFMAVDNLSIGAGFVAATPEPSSALMVMGGLLLLTQGRRRKRA